MKPVAWLFENRIVFTIYGTTAADAMYIVFTFYTVTYHRITVSSFHDFLNKWLNALSKSKSRFSLDGFEPFASVGKWQVIIFSKNCLRRLTGPYHPQ